MTPTSWLYRSVLTLTMVASAPVLAGQEVFLRIDGVRGSATRTGYERFHEVDSFDLSAHRDPNSPTSATLWSNLGVAMRIGPAYTALLEASFAGTPIAEVEIHSVTQGRVYRSIKLFQAKVTSVANSKFARADRVEFSFRDIEFRRYSYDRFGNLTRVDPAQVRNATMGAAGAVEIGGNSFPFLSGFVVPQSIRPMEATDYGFAVSRSGNATRATPVSVTLPITSLRPRLWELCASGRRDATTEIKMQIPGNPKSLVTLSLTNAQIVKVATVDHGNQQQFCRVDFAYEKLTLDTFDPVTNKTQVETIDLTRPGAAFQRLDRQPRPIPQADFDAFVEFKAVPGTNWLVPGNYQGWHNAFGLSTEVLAPSTSGPTRVGPIRLQMMALETQPTFLNSTMSGKILGDVKLDLVRRHTPGQPFLELEMTGVRIVETRSDSSHVFLEVALQPETIRWTYSYRSPTGGYTRQTFGWDLIKNRKL